MASLGMMNSVYSSLLKGYRFPRSIVSYAVWGYHRFVLSLHDVVGILLQSREMSAQSMRFP